MNYQNLPVLKIPAVLLIILFSVSVFQTGLSQESINWVSWEQVQSLMKKQKRKIVVDIYTDWCGWCKRMDATTFQDPRIVKYVNKNYYAVKFNAEHKDEITFKSRNYKFIANGRRGVHELAIEITNGQLSYPTFVFMDEELSTIQPIPGYQDADTFEVISNYFAGNHYKTTPYQTFQEKFKAGLKK
jgi:thioredoxin-related protein